MSNKLKLHVEDLAIDTFETAPVEEKTGTVHGASQTEWNTCPGYGQTCDGGNTCWDSCDGVCDTYYCTPNTCSIYCQNPRNIPNTYAPTCWGVFTCKPQC